VFECARGRERETKRDIRERVLFIVRGRELIEGRGGRVI
jgi:hypothetical protein